MVLGPRKWGRGIMPTQEVFLSTPSPGAGARRSVSALGRCPELKEGTGHLQTCLLFPRGILCAPCTAWHWGDNNTCSGLSPSDSQTRLPASQDTVSLFRRVFPFCPTETWPRRLFVLHTQAPQRFLKVLSSSLQDPCFFEDHTIKLSPSPVVVPVSSFHASWFLTSHLLVDSNTL